MNTNIEIEYKSKIPKYEYERLISKFNLEDKIFKQVNYYFDTADKDLFNVGTTLRIRQKEKYKLTKKVHTNKGTIETNVFLSDKQAKSMIAQGFDASIIDENLNVSLIATLTTLRCKCQYKNGELFFDCSMYDGHIDYEVEFEAPDLNSEHIFQEFLDENKITYTHMKSKSYRAISK